MVGRPSEFTLKMRTLPFRLRLNIVCGIALSMQAARHLRNSGGHFPSTTPQRVRVCLLFVLVSVTWPGAAYADLAIVEHADVAASAPLSSAQEREGSPSRTADEPALPMTEGKQLPQSGSDEPALPSAIDLVSVDVPAEERELPSTVEVEPFERLVEEPVVPTSKAGDVSTAIDPGPPRTRQQKAEEQAAAKRAAAAARRDAAAQRERRRDPVDDAEDAEEAERGASRKEARREAERLSDAAKDENRERAPITDDDRARYWPARVSDFPVHSPYYTLGEYDWNLARRVLEDARVLPDHAPKGKVICEIHYAPQDIFLPDEPFPLFFNKFHSTTRTSTVAASAPVHVGDIYSELLREDVRLELQDPEVYSTVVVVPVRSVEENCVEIYVVTRDLWSLRFGFEPRLSGGVVDFLGISVQETNFLGLNDTIGVDFAMERGSWEFGPIWEADWFMNRNLLISEKFRLIFDREEGGYEGTSNTFKLARPLRSSWDKSAWYFEGHHRAARGRVFDGAQMNQLSYVNPEDSLTYVVDERWNDLKMTFEGGYTRSYGLKYKHLLTSGLFVDLRNATPAPMDSSIPESVLELFAADRLPRSERAIGFHLRWEFYYNRYFYLTNYNSYAISEGYRKGLSLMAQLRYSEPVLGADVRFLQGEAGVAYVLPLGEDGLFSMGGMMGIRAAVVGLVDRRLELSTRLVLPSGVGGRFVIRGWARFLNEDTANERFRVGATSSLRGFAGNAAEGYNAWLTNVEWRSKPVEVLSLFFGLAAFLDVGSAWERSAYERTFASVGLGLRFFIPQAMARPGSLDVAFPIGQSAWMRGMPSPVISLRFGHAFQPLETLAFDELWR